MADNGDIFTVFTILAIY